MDKMSNRILIFLISFVLSNIGVGCREFKGGMPMRWENDYKTSLSSSNLLGDKEARTTIELSRSYWKSHPTHQQFHKLSLTKISDPLRSSIRLEIGNANEESYFGIWFFEGSEKVQLCANTPQSPSIVECKEVLPAKYQKLWDRLEQAQVWNLKSDGTRVGSVLDGTAYFISIHRMDRSHQFVTYAPQLVSTTSDPQGKVVKAILDASQGS